MQNPSCPHPDELSAYALGTLNAAVADQLADHIEHCASCEETLQNLDGTVDSVLSELRQPAVASPFADEAAYQQVLSVVEAFSNEPSLDALRRDWTTTGAEGDFPQLRDYRILAKLGQGGMGAVYKALHTRLEKIVAIKVLSVSLLSNAHAIDRFSREMKAIGRLEHPNLIRAHDAGEFEGRHFLVMEYVNGVDLSELTRSLGRLPIPEACELIRQAALGLEYAHQQGLVHRDIKPSNLILSTDGQVKILDMGLALLNHRDDPICELTSTGQIMGTVDYMAPEQGGDTHHVDIRADIYSLGATLCKLLTGQTPFANPAHTTLMQKLTALATQQPVPLRERRPDVPAALAEIVDGMLARLPERRYATPLAVAHALQPYCRGADLHRLNPGSTTTQADFSASDASVVDAPTQLVTTADTDPSVAGSLAVTRIGSSTGGPHRPRGWLKWSAFGAVALLAGFILYLTTPEGATVRVEISDPQTQAVFDGTGLLITSAQNDQAPIRVKVGTSQVKEGARELGDVKHTLHITRGDTELITPEFELKRRGETLIKIELVGNSLRATSDGQILGEKPITPQPAPSVATTKPARLGYESPEFAKWVDHVRAMPAEEQAAAVVKKIKELNPKYEGEPTYHIHDNQLWGFTVFTDQVTDLSPVRAFPHLTTLSCNGSQTEQGMLEDLSPLAGLKLTLLNCSNSRVADLSALRGMPLKELYCGNAPVVSLEPLRGAPLHTLWCYITKITDLSGIEGMQLVSISFHNNPPLKDLSPLKGMPLKYVSVYATSISDLSPLAGAPIEILECGNTSIADLTPIRGMKLKALYCSNSKVTEFSMVREMPLESIGATFDLARDSELLQSISTLRTINDKPAAEFWEDAKKAP